MAEEAQTGGGMEPFDAFLRLTGADLALRQMIPQDADDLMVLAWDAQAHRCIPPFFYKNAGKPY